MTSISPAPNGRALAALLRQSDSDLDLVHAALIVARDVDPQLDGAACERLLDCWADAVAGRIAASGLRVADGELVPTGAEAMDPGLPRHLWQRQAGLEALRALNEVLFDEAGFQGNTEDYYDPRNSYLNEVLARRTGIPITLALVYIAVARRVGLHLYGVGLPGHFLVGYHLPDSADDPGLALYVDPFHGGVLRSPGECRAIVEGLYGHRVPFAAHWLAPVTPRLFLARLLDNLKSIYLDAGDWAQALRIVDYLLVVQPQAWDELRLRGMLYYRLGAFLPALSDLKHYVHARPDAPDADQVRYYTRLLHTLLFAAN